MPAYSGPGLWQELSTFLRGETFSSPSPVKFARHFVFHRFIFIAGALGILTATPLGVEMNAEDAPILSAAILITFGMPHGAFDVAVASRQRNTDSGFSRLKFIAEYVGAAAFVLLFWHFFPGEGLCAFLALSALHFAEDWENEIPPFASLIIGASLLAFPALFHQTGVRVIFEMLVPSNDAALLSAGLHSFAWGLLPFAAATLAYQLPRRPSAMAEASLVLALSILVTPLTFFIFYFCGLHSIRHLFHVREQLPTGTAASLFSLGFPYALAASAGVAAAAALSYSSHLGSAMLGSVFTCLAALTVPHMLLVND
jgi:Brp/Blh family beta-carotene 15,15'-monooxygenase